ASTGSNITPTRLIARITPATNTTGTSSTAAIRPTMIEGTGSASRVAPATPTRDGTAEATTSPRTSTTSPSVPVETTERNRSNQLAEGLGASGGLTGGFSAGATCTCWLTPCKDSAGALTVPPTWALGSRTTLPPRQATLPPTELLGPSVMSPHMTATSPLTLPSISALPLTTATLPCTSP